jgi:hypothetical protein
MFLCPHPILVSGQQVEKAHNADLHCVDWNPHDDNLILTGYVSILCFLQLCYAAKM